MTMNPEQQRFFLAMLERECPEKWYVHGTPALNSHSPKCQCKGTGRVPLLDVREPCTGAAWLESSMQHNEHCVCHGTKWTPTKDAWKWLEAVLTFAWVGFRSLPSGIHVVCIERSGFQDDYGDGGSALEAFYAALSEALTPLATNAAEAGDWVREHIRA